MLAVGFWASLMLAALPVQVESADCPKGSEIEQALASRLAPASPDARPDRAQVWKQDGLLHIKLSAPDGAVIAERVLVERATCEETAELVAVMIASWATDVHPAFVEPPASIAAAANAGASTPPKAVESPASSLSSYDFAIGAGPSLAGSVALAGLAGFTWIPRGRGLGLGIFAFGDRQRSLSLGQGQVAWNRFMGGAAVDWRSSRGRLSFDAYAGLFAGWLSVEGRDFDSNQTQTSFSPAVALGGRLAWWANHHFAVWLDILGVLSLRGQSVYALPDGEERKLPVFQGLALLGIAAGRANHAR
jgi:hypothetical protein